MTESPRILYCHCAYAQVVPKQTKDAVLKHLCDSGVAFDAVADLCEMAARQDPALKSLAESGRVKIAACFPRAVKWLFASAKAPLPADGTEVINMRVQAAEEVIAALVNPDVKPNLPNGKTVVNTANLEGTAPSLPSTLEPLTTVAGNDEALPSKFGAEPATA